MVFDIDEMIHKQNLYLFNQNISISSSICNKILKNYNFNYNFNACFIVVMALL